MKKFTFKIEGMMCPHCSGRVKDALLAVEGITEADVSHERGDAIIKTDAAFDCEQARLAIENAGYKVIE